MSTSLTTQLTNCAEHAGRVGGRECGDRHHPARLGDDELSGRHVGSIPGHSRDTGAFPMTQRDATSPVRTAILRIGTPHQLERRSTCSRRPSPSQRRKQLQTTVTLPVTLSCMEITFRREMLGWDRSDPFPARAHRRRRAGHVRRVAVFWTRTCDCAAACRSRNHDSSC